MLEEGGGRWMIGDDFAKNGLQKLGNRCSIHLSYGGKRQTFSPAALLIDGGAGTVKLVAGSGEIISWRALTVLQFGHAIPWRADSLRRFDPASWILPAGCDS